MRQWRPLRTSAPRGPLAAGRDRRYLDSLMAASADGLGDPMANGHIRLDPLAEAHRASLKAACAEDREIWPIYAISYDPDHFDASFDALLARPNGRGFAIFSADALVGMSCYLGVDESRGVLEIGNTYYVPARRGTGLNRRVKDLMISTATARSL